jgi:hypothetical protein
MTFPIDISEQAGVRYLHFGSSWVQGAMRIARPWNLELEYTREMMASLLLRDDPHWPRKVLLIGLGAQTRAAILQAAGRPQAHQSRHRRRGGISLGQQEKFRFDSARRL